MCTIAVESPTSFNKTVKNPVLPKILYGLTVNFTIFILYENELWVGPRQYCELCGWPWARRAQERNARAAQRGKNLLKWFTSQNRHLICGTSWRRNFQVTSIPWAVMGFTKIAKEAIQFHNCLLWWSKTTGKSKAGIMFMATVRL